MIRIDGATIHVHPREVVLVRPGAQDIHLPMANIPIEAFAWRTSLDGRWLTGATRSRIPVLIDLKLGRLVSPMPGAWHGPVVRAWFMPGGVVAGCDAARYLLAFPAAGHPREQSLASDEGSGGPQSHACAGHAIVRLDMNSIHVHCWTVDGAGIAVRWRKHLPPTRGTSLDRALWSLEDIDDRSFAAMDCDGTLRHLVLGPDIDKGIVQDWSIPDAGHTLASLVRCADGRIAIGTAPEPIDRASAVAAHQLGATGIYDADTGRRSTVFHLADGEAVRNAAVIPVRGDPAHTCRSMAMLAPPAAGGRQRRDCGTCAAGTASARSRRSIAIPGPLSRRPRRGRRSAPTTTAAWSSARRPPSSWTPALRCLEPAPRPPTAPSPSSLVRPLAHLL